MVAQYCEGTYLMPLDCILKVVTMGNFKFAYVTTIFFNSFN